MACSGCAELLPAPWRIPGVIGAGPFATECLLRFACALLAKPLVFKAVFPRILPRSYGGRALGFACPLVAVGGVNLVVFRDSGGRGVLPICCHPAGWHNKTRPASRQVGITGSS